MIETQAAVEPRGRTEVQVKIVDVDVHPQPRADEEIFDRLPAPWRSNRQGLVVRSSSLVTYSAPPKRADAYGSDGTPPCADPVLTERQVFGDAGVDYAILLPMTVPPTCNPLHEAALATATNRWLAETWLSAYNRHGRYRGSITIGGGDPVAAAREIETWAGHPDFVQVVLPPYAVAPFGHPQYYPIYEAAARHGLPVVMHVATRSAGMGLLSPVGFASYYFEHHPNYATLAAAHLTSLLCEGVFERFPRLRFVFVEGGFSWVVPLLWRLDRHWRALRAEVPALRRPPSAYVREHVRFSTQPIEEPRDRRHFLRALEWGAADRILMFATDYPHWDGDYLPELLFAGVPEPLLRRILCENARELYGLPATRPAA
jgi:predicted TIM-barrel fold metal-dependent hydrolase